MFRRELVTRNDVFEKRYLSFSQGFDTLAAFVLSIPYMGIAVLSRRPQESSHLENWVLIDRNRGEMRFIGGKAFTKQYSNKLQVERDFRSRDGFRVTPYIYGELYYGARYNTMET